MRKNFEDVRLFCYIDLTNKSIVILTETSKFSEHFVIVVSHYKVNAIHEREYSFLVVPPRNVIIKS